ncbi:MAG: ORF6N domain-containing protein [Methylococcales symbiont of Hymedesmia sp. n. MRB-2018]|nr:MAG: ORF6N domain-containing protein [Methylococcales symbiont of Hymedesmia sp. n. MRB-2018]
MQSIEPFIIELRSQKVILDSDVAKIYGVETRDINKAVKNNLDKFPDGYIFKLSKHELEYLRGNFSTTNNTMQLSKTRVLPKAFTEKGLYMLATIIKSKQATNATLQIIETFAKVREFSNVAKSLATEKSELKKQSLIKKSGQLIGDILNQEFADDTSSETTIELNLAMIKIKHKIIKNKK